MLLYSHNIGGDGCKDICEHRQRRRQQKEYFKNTYHFFIPADRTHFGLFNLFIIAMLIFCIVVFVFQILIAYVYIQLGACLQILIKTVMAY